VGGAYLIWVGITALRRRRNEEEQPDPQVGRRPLLGAGFLSGLATDLFNPKVGVFFVSFLPAFVPRGANVGVATAAFGATFIIETLLYFLVLIALADRVTRWMTAARRRRQLDRATGVILIGFGVRLATEAQ
jgi:threonine/homoserine/homoserine lactone efflux protein